MFFVRYKKVQHFKAEIMHILITDNSDSILRTISLNSITLSKSNQFRNAKYVHCKFRLDHDESRRNLLHVNWSNLILGKNDTDFTFKLFYDQHVLIKILCTNTRSNWTKLDYAALG